SSRPSRSVGTATPAKLARHAGSDPLGPGTLTASAKPTKRTGYRKSEDSRRLVLDAAIATLAQRGLASTSIQDIADAAGLSKGANQSHFESKDKRIHDV